MTHDQYARRPHVIGPVVTAAVISALHAAIPSGMTDDAIVRLILECPVDDFILKRGETVWDRLIASEDYPPIC